VEHYKSGTTKIWKTEKKSTPLPISATLVDYDVYG